MRWPRIGFGYDVHKFAPHRPLILGSVEIPFDVGLDGHSDADVLLHAIADAVLGAVALGDIGVHFPPSDPQWKGMDSGEILRHAVKLIGELGWVPGNVDAMVVAEAPRIGPYVSEMRENIAPMLRVSVQDVSIKATTNEGMGFVGRQEGIAALATVLILPGETS